MKIIVVVIARLTFLGRSFQSLIVGFYLFYFSHSGTVST